MLASTPSNRDSAIQLLQQSDYEKSIEFLMRAIEEQPSDVDLQIYLAYAHSQMGDMDKSIEILEQAAELAPTSAKVRYNLGVAYQRAHNSTQAKDEYMHALGLDAKYTPARTALDALFHVSHGGDTPPAAP